MSQVIWFLVVLSAIPFIRGSTDIFQFVGCYKDNFNDRDLYGPYGVSSPADVAAPECAAICFSGNYKFFGLQYKTACWCGNTYGRHGTLPLSECNSDGNVLSSDVADRCGNGKDDCGTKNAIYEIISDPPSLTDQTSFSNTTVNVHHFPVTGNITRMHGYSVLPSGQCGPKCRIPERMATAVLGSDHFITAWNAALDTRLNGGTCQMDILRGQFSVFKHSGNDVSLVATVPLPYCDIVGDIVVSSDDKTMAVLCGTSRVKLAPFITRNMWEDAQDFKWDARDKFIRSNGSSVDAVPDLLLLEFTLNGPIADIDWGAVQPTSVVHCIQTYTGYLTTRGYGQLELSVDETRYLVQSIVQHGASHKSFLGFQIDRDSWTLQGTTRSCAPGHTWGNFMAKNDDLDEIASVCFGDGTSSFGRGGIETGYRSNGDGVNDLHGEYATLIGAPKINSANIEYVSMNRPYDLISDGAKGFIAITGGNEGEFELKASKVGIIRLPASSSDVDPANPGWKWLKFADINSGDQPEEIQLAAFNIQRIGDANKGDLYLLGYTSSNGHQYPRNNLLVLLDSDFNMVGQSKDVTSITRFAQWDHWTKLPDGCVAWVYTWLPDSPDGHNIAYADNACTQKIPRLSVTKVCTEAGPTRADPTRAENDSSAQGLSPSLVSAVFLACIFHSALSHRKF